MWFLRQNILRQIVTKFRLNMSTNVSSIEKLVKYRTDHIVKSSEDKRLYRGYELINGLKVLLISDHETDKAAASLDVCVGSMCDPKEVPGLAHYCEHMLFMGTKKYPVENEFMNYLTLHGGGSNAYTDHDHTNYQLEVAPENLDGAIDRFAQFFIAPLFHADSSEREVMAVDSEYRNALQNDSARLNYLVEKMSKPGHSYGAFGWGNRASLWDMCEAPSGVKLCPIEQLLKFYDAYYSSNLMTLAILGKDSLDDLALLVVPLFAQVPNKCLTRLVWKDHPYTKEQMARKIMAVPLKDIRSLRLTFATPDLTALYKSKPGDYVSHLLGHEGKGSLLHELKQRAWANELSACQETPVHGFGLFKIDIELSNEGLHNVDAVVELVFEYINTVLLKQEPQLWVFEEMQRLYNIQFKFQDQKQPEDAVLGLSPAMHDYKMEEVLTAPHYMLETFDGPQITKLVNRLRPENVLVSIASKDFEGKTDQFDKWFQVHYSTQLLESSLIEKCSSVSNHDRFFLPRRNNFIPSQFGLIYKSKPETTKFPEVISRDSLHRCWYKQDDHFQLPKACVCINFRSPKAYSTPGDFVRMYMLIDMLKDLLTDYAYDAHLAGLNYCMKNDQYGINVEVDGFSEKQTPFVLQLVESLLKTEELELKRFEVLKERYVRKLKNFSKKQPYEQAKFYFNFLLNEKSYDIVELLKEAENVKLDDIKEQRKKFFQNTYIDTLVAGNTCKQDSDKLLSSIQNLVKKSFSSLPIPEDQLKNLRTIKLAGNGSIFELLSEVHSNSAMALYLQTNLEATKENMLSELLEQIINEQFFDQLRTKEQLGYIVCSQVKNVNGVRGLYFLIQGSKSPPELEDRAEAFILNLRDMLKDMPQDEFDEHKESLATMRLEKPKTLNHQCCKFWSEIKSDQYHFDRDNVEVEALRKIKKKELMKFYENFVAPNANGRRKLSIHVYGTDAQPVKRLKTSNQIFSLDGVAEFKTKQGLFDRPSAFVKLPLANGNCEEKEKSKKCKL